jgi:xanthine dehydrogenase YagT iron-sulfur-binding subunit
MARDGQRDDSDDRPSGGLSRRAFLRGSALAGIGAGIGSELLRGAPAAAAARAVEKARTEEGVTLIGPGPVAMSFQVNGHPYSAKLEPRVTLLDALREHLDLTGAKKVCDRGTCGACTVILEGKTVYSCSVLALEAQGREIQTVEGLGTVEKLHPLQAAFVEHDAQQCGFCTPGFVMSAKALLDFNPSPSLPEIHHALSGNFCRCGTYAGMRRAVMGAAAAIAAGEGAGAEDEEPERKPKKKRKRERRHDG